MPDQFRPLVTVIRPSADGTTISVTLDQHGWIAEGMAPIEDGDVLAAACQATCRAVSSLLPEGVEVWFSSLQHLEGDEWSRPIVLTSVRLREGGQVVEELLGAAWVRNDVQVAAVRATLDGLTRRLSAFLT